MSAQVDKKARKQAYWGKLERALMEYKNVLIISVDFVGSKQMQTIRADIRGKGEIVMGKNTIIRRVIRNNMEKYPKLEALLPFIKGNMGFVFTNGDLNSLRKKVCEMKLPAAAKAGVISQRDVTVPAGPTGLDPGQTAFFQTLNIGTKIVKGTIEITNEVKVCTMGEKVSASAVALLAKMNIQPFEFGIEVTMVYENGSTYDPSVLDLSPDDLADKFGGAVAKLAAISFEMGVINRATVPHSFGRAFRAIAAIAIETEYDFEEMKLVKTMMAGGGSGGGVGAAAPVAAAKAPEPEEEEEEAAPAMDMFGGGDEDAEAGDY
jgi:large subunit ribosomal protein LP0